MPVSNLLDVVETDMDDLRRKVDMLEAEAARLRDLLAASEARHALILESATDYAIITTDLAGRVTGWNVGAHNVLGWQEVEALGQPAHLFCATAPSGSWGSVGGVSGCYTTIM